MVICIFKIKYLYVPSIQLVSRKCNKRIFFLKERDMFCAYERFWYRNSCSINYVKVYYIMHTLILETRCLLELSKARGTRTVPPHKLPFVSNMTAKTPSQISGLD